MPVREAQRKHEDPIAAILSSNPARCFIGQGGRRRTARHEGFLRGRTRFDGTDEYKGAALELNFQNEWIVAWLDKKPIAMSPDLICVLDSVSGEAVGTETIRYGQRVTVIAPAAAAGVPVGEGPETCRPARLRHDIDFRACLREFAQFTADDHRIRWPSALDSRYCGGGNPSAVAEGARARHVSGPSPTGTPAAAAGRSR